MVRHPDFEKIHATFLQHYSKDPQLGEARYLQWLTDSGLDEARGYYEQGAERAQNTQSFAWADFLLQFVKEDQDAKYYKVEALFPVESMNKDSPPFTRDEVLQAARSLTGKPSDLNHDPSQMLEGVEIVAAQFEDDCVECLVRVIKTSVLNSMIERKEIVSVSIEGEWSHGLPGSGLVLTGLGWLTKHSTLPGIPLTRIVPVEQIVESYAVQAQNNEGEIMEEKDVEKLAEKLAAKLSAKEAEKLAAVEAELEEKKTALTQAEGKLTETEGKLAEANKTIEKLKQLVPGVDLLANPPKLMPVSEALERLERLELPKMQERLSLGNQLQAQKVRKEIFEVKQKYGVA